VVWPENEPQNEATGPVGGAATGTATGLATGLATGSAIVDGVTNGHPAPQLKSLTLHAREPVKTETDPTGAADDTADDPAERTEPHGTNASDEPGEAGRPDGAFGFYLVSVMSLVVSVDTSWRFFQDVLGITNTGERVVMFAVIEVALIACGYGMRANVRQHGRPGAPRLFAWLLCGLAGYMAWQLSGLATGIARVALGPVLGLVMLHLALGIEVHARRGPATTTWARLGRELRERMLSWFGLGDHERDAVALTRERAARRVARLSLGTIVLFRKTRVARAVRTSNVSHDDQARARLLTELAAIRHADELATLDQASPWTSSPAPAPVTTATTAATTSPSAVPAIAARGGVAAPVTRPESRARTSGPTSSRASSPARQGPVGGRAAGSRRPLAGWVAAAREHLAPDAEITPAWVRSVLPDCPRSTSKNVADALNAGRDPAQEDT
jgi:hypothetical protein